MRHYNIFDEIINNEDVDELALCAIYELFETFLREFETSAFYRVKGAFKDLHREAHEKEILLNDDKPLF